jgi:hypothetical protein
MLKKFVKMLRLKKKSAYVIYKWPQRSNVWSRSDAVSAHPTLLKPFIGLRSELNGDSEQLDDLDPNVFLAPFLDVIRSDVVTGKSFSEALIFTSTNPQYDKKMSIELPV